MRRAWGPAAVIRHIWGKSCCGPGRAGDVETGRGPPGAAGGAGAALRLLSGDVRFGGDAQAWHVKAVRGVWGSNLITRLVILLNEPTTS